jgi:hypothetical protein
MTINTKPGEPTRGERNNNPGNVTKSESFKWYGEIPGTDSRFATFDTPENGIRTIARLLKGYQVRSGLRTLRAIINRYAPGHENPTDAYVAYVAEHAGVGADDEVNVQDADTMKKIIWAIIHFENGRVVYADSVLSVGVLRGLS